MSQRILFSFTAALSPPSFARLSYIGTGLFPFPKYFILHKDEMR